MDHERIPIRTQRLEDVPELIHHIQSLLPEEEAARTCVLSKSWLHAWSTIPTLRFTNSKPNVTEKQEQDHMKFIDLTLLRYHKHNIPIESLNLQLCINNHHSVFLAEKWIHLVASRSSLTELSLTTLRIPADVMMTNDNTLWVSSKTLIKCVSLRVLELVDVNISEKVLDNILSTCNLLEKINLSFNKRLKRIEIKNLHYLRELKIISRVENDILEIADVPNLRSFYYDSTVIDKRKPIPFKTNSSLNSVTQLHLGGVIMDDALFDMIQSNFPILESLNLELGTWGPKRLDITSNSMKRLSLRFWQNDNQINIKVFAPKLRFFCYDGSTIPSLSFPTVVPEQIKLILKLRKPIDDDSFFLEMRETLNISSKFDIDIFDMSFELLVSLDININDLRKNIAFPAKNVEQLKFKTLSGERLWERSQFFNAFFSICHPTYVNVYEDTMFAEKYVCKLMVREFMEKKIEKKIWSNLKDVEIKNPCNGNWETLTSSWMDFFDGSDLGDWFYAEFKLNWCSPNTSRLWFDDLIDYFRFLSGFSS